MSDDKDDNQTVVWAVLVSVVVLAVSLAIGFGIAKSKKAPSTAPVVTAAAPAEAASEAVAQASAPAVESSVPSVAPVLAANESAVRVENGVVKFYFASGKATLAAGAKEALAEVVQAAAQGKKLVLSGFHDSTGSPEMNAQLAKQRALSVKAALTGLGVKDAQMTLKNAESVVTSAGADAQARRVEVSIE
jgi:outer membrane protein OmpA-like peptidoglycan-associated protein